MRVGILSLNPGHNIGGILQSFALMTVLKRMGHNVTVICKDVYEKEPDILHFYKYGVRLLLALRYRSDWRETVFYERTRNRKPRYLRQNTDSFMNKYMNRKFVSEFSCLKETDFDCIIVGSDQVWRKKYFEDQYSQSICNAFLSFAEQWKVKKISYAASFGTDEWEYTDDDTKRCGELLQKFDAVSVREESGIWLCEDKFGVKAKCTLDPTLLLTKEDYVSIFNLNEVAKSKGDLMVYVLDKSDTIDAVVSNIVKERGLTSFEIGDNNGCYPKVEEWLRGFMDAELVITDSFHACVFSMIFHKPFIVVGNKERGMTRFESFLAKFKLENRMTYDIEYVAPEIDYAYSDDVLKVLRDESYDFLKSI